jgi:hypothetical protein
VRKATNTTPLIIFIGGGLVQRQRYSLFQLLVA